MASLKKTKAVADAGADSVRDSAYCFAAAASLIGCFVLENSTSQEFLSKKKLKIISFLEGF